MSLYPKHASAPVETLIVTNPAPRKTVTVKWAQYPDEPPFEVRLNPLASGLALWASMENL